MTRERELRDQLIQDNRPQRVPLHEQKRSVLTASNQEKGYIYRWVNDTINPDGTSRVEAFKKAGYDVVNNTQTKVGDNDGNISLGTIPQASVGKGRKAILMRIKKEFYDADQRVKQSAITEQENLLMRRKKEAKDAGEDGTYGEVSLDRK